MASSKAPTEEKLYGLLAEFDSPGSLVKAARVVRKAGYKKFDCHSPFPVHGLDPAMGIRHTILPLVVFGGGVTGLLGAILLQWWANAYNWPWIVSGKPFFSLPMQIPIAFEGTILLSAFAAFFGMWALNQLPQVWHPLFGKERFLKVTDDGFFVAVEASDPNFEAGKTADLLREAGATAVEEVKYRTSPEARKIPKGIVGFILITSMLALVPFALIAEARVSKSEEPHYHVIPNMDFQPKNKSQTASPVFPDGRATRIPPDGTVAREDQGRIQNDHLYRGIVEGTDEEGEPTGEDVWATTFPPEIELSQESIERGKERFEIYCRPCHGDDGGGNGMINARAQDIRAGQTGWNPPTNLTEVQVVKQPHGQLFNTITWGIRTMPGYGAQIPVEDRWKIVLYVRALQRSRNAEMSDVPRDLRSQIR